MKSTDHANPHNELFDEPSWWRAEAAIALGLDADELIAAVSPGASFPAVLRSLVASLPLRPTTIVDLGSGVGGASEWFRRATGATVIAVEPAEGAHRASRRLFPELISLRAPAHATGLADRSCDVVVISGVLSLMADLDPVLDEVGRILETTGALAVADLFSATSADELCGPNTFRSFDTLAQALAQRNFHVVDVGSGAAQANGTWEAAAARVEQWIWVNRRHLPAYVAWDEDRTHLRRLVECEVLLGGCFVARRLPTWVSERGDAD